MINLFVRIENVTQTRHLLVENELKKLKAFYSIYFRDRSLFEEDGTQKRYGSFSHPSGGTGRNVIIFGVDMSSSTKTDNRKKDILILVKGATQGLEHTLSTEKLYSINFSEKKQKLLFKLAL